MAFNGRDRLGAKHTSCTGTLIRTAIILMCSEIADTEEQYAGRDDKQ